MHLESIVNCLNQVELFSALCENDVALFAELAKPQALLYDDILCTCRDHTDALYVIEKVTRQRIHKTHEKKHIRPIYKRV